MMPATGRPARSGPIAIAAATLMLCAGLTACGGTSAPATSSSPAGGTTTTSESSSSSAETSAASATSQAIKTPISAKGKTYEVTVTKVIDPAHASAPWGGEADQHFVALELSMRQTDPNVAGGAVNGSCFTAKDSDGNPAKISAGYVTKGATAIEGIMAGKTPVTGELVVEVPQGKHLKSVTAKCDARSQDKVVVTLG